MVLLLLFDLSTTIYTIYHGLLLQRLEFENGIKGSVLAWFCSYLAERCEHINVNFEVSANTALQCGVLQGSVLGPILLTIYTSQLRRIINRYQTARQHPVDDTQLESPCDTDEHSVKAKVKNLEHCCRDIKTRMLEKRLQLNGDKTEVLPCGLSSLQKVALIGHIQAVELQISMSATVTDLRMATDANFDMTAHLSGAIKSYHCHLRSLRKLRPFLTQDAANAIAVSLIMSRLDHCNSNRLGL